MPIANATGYDLMCQNNEELISSWIFKVYYIPVDGNCITDHCKLVSDKLMPAYPIGPCKSCQSSGVSNRLPPDLWGNR